MEVCGTACGFDSRGGRKSRFFRLYGCRGDGVEEDRVFTRVYRLWGLLVRVVVLAKYGRMTREIKWAKNATKVKQIEKNWGKAREQNE